MQGQHTHPGLLQDRISSYGDHSVSWSGEVTPSKEEGAPLCQEHSRQQNLRIFRKTDWFLEIGSSMLAVLFLAGIVILLALMQNQPLSAWPSAVSPNAFIAVLSAALKSCLLLPISECLSQLKWTHLLRSKRSNRLEDLEAFDRASKGSFGAWRFFWEHPTRSVLPFIGCVLTIIAIATEPFTQQILRIEQRLTQSPDVFASTSASQIYDFGTEGDASQSGDAFQLPRDTPMLSAITVSLYDQLRAPDFSCPGVLCEYPPVASIGVTSQCQDVTTSTKANCSSASSTSASEKCYLTTPSGISLFAQTAFDAHWGFTHTRVNTTINSTRLVASRHDDILSMAVVRLPSNGGYDEWKDGMQVYECTFELCAVEYTGWRVVNGTTSPGTWTPYALNLTEGGYVAEYTVLDETFAQNRTFYINSMDMTNMYDLLADNFAPAAANSVKLNEPLYTSDDIPGKIANVSRAMAYRMLSGPNMTETPVPVYIQENFIRVQWAWLSFPAALVLASCLFLLTIVWQTYRTDQLVWKSSLTPILMSDTSYPLSTAAQRPVWTDAQLKARTATIINHLTR